MDKDLLIKTLLLSVMLVETFDELETQAGYIHDIKRKGKQFKVLLEKYCNEVFDNCEEDILGTEYVAKITAELDKIIKDG